MVSIKESINQLKDAIYENEVFINFEREKLRLIQYPEKKAKADEYRRRNYQLQSCSDQIDLLQEYEKLEQEFRETIKDEIIRSFLDAELAVCRLLQSITDEMTGMIDLDLEQVL